MIKIKKYLLIKVSLIFLVFLFFNLFVLLANNLGFKSLQQELVNYQLKKINKNNQTIFLGDSSLGHGINSKLWSELSNKSSSNIALTGNFSFGGANIILEKILKKRKKIETVIIINNVYAWQENIKHSGYEYIEKQSNVILKYLNYLDKNIFEIKKFYFSFFFDENLGNYSELITNDFMKFGDKISKDANYTFDIDLFNKNKSFYLKKIIDLCSEYQIECIYFHGPIYNTACTDKNFEFFKRINDQLLDMNIIFDPSIICLNYNQIGDTIYHTSSNYKNNLTKTYYEKYLKLKKN